MAPLFPRPIADVLAGVSGAVADACADALAVVAPSTCIGCGRADRGLCDDCRLLFAAAQPHLTRRLGEDVWCALDYAGAPRLAILAFKDAGRTEVAAVLGAALGRAVAAALAGAGAGRPVELVTAPSAGAAFRERGFHPVNTLLAAAGLRAAPLLRHTAVHADQVGLGRGQRRRNLGGSMGLRARAGEASLEGRRFLVVDDILTTGATVAEVARAMRAGGAVVCGAAVLADTRLRGGPHPAPSKFG